MSKFAKFGPGGNSSLFAEKGHKSSLDAPAWVKEMGLDAYEYECGKGVNASLETFAEIGIRAAQLGVCTSLHAPYFISLSSVEEAKRLNSVRYIMQSLEAAKALGAGVIVVHAGSASKIDRLTALSYARDTVEKALSASEESGLDEIKIGLETMGKINQLGTLDEIIELCSMDKRLVPVIDFGHLYARDHGGDMDTSDKVKSAFEKVSAKLGGEVAENMHCHFSCIEYSNGGEVKHLTFENTTFGPDPSMFAKTLAEIGVAPTVICESAGTQDIDAYFMKQEYLKGLNQ